MADTKIICIGPIDGAPADRAFMLAPLTGEISAETIIFAGDAIDGLQKVLDNFSHRRVQCEPALHVAAHVLDLPVADLNSNELELRVDLALCIENAADLPATEPPGLRRYLLQGISNLKFSPCWARFDDGSMAFASIQGVSVGGRCDAEATVTFGFTPETHIHVVADRPEHFDLQIFFHDRPRYIIEALLRAYALSFRPSLRLDGAAPPVGWLERWGPAVGSVLYTLSLLGSHQLHQSLQLDDPSGVHLACQVEMLSSGQQ